MIDLRDRCPPTPPEFGGPTHAESTNIRARRKALDDARDRIRGIVESGQTPKTEDFPNEWQYYRERLRDAHHRKCAYCESRFVASYPGAIEHYRPKTAVKGIIKLSSGGFSKGSMSKPGYWWLAYSFENWVFSCFSCNTAKGTYFPLQSKAGPLEPGAEASEKAELINPLRADPTGAFDFDEYGGIYARGGDAADYTLYICKLDRPDLIIERKRVAVTIIRDIEAYVHAVVMGDKVLSKELCALRDACHPDAPYAAMARQLVARVDLDWPTLRDVTANLP